MRRLDPFTPPDSTSAAFVSSSAGATAPVERKRKSTIAKERVPGVAGD
jgi:hypothetical protein